MTIRFMLPLLMWCVACDPSSLFGCQLSSESPETTPQPSSNPVVTQRNNTAEKSRSQTLTARGRVFVDVDGDGVFGDQDQRFSGVRVSNGREIVTTDKQGAYELPLNDGQILFVIKPSGFRCALNENQLPRFFYIHKPAGSPKLTYPGSPPTGPLPESIDFPLYRNDEPEEFRIVLFGDPQPRSVTEVDYIAEDVVAELIGCQHAFGVSLGDLAFDHLETLEPLNQTIGLIGIPWYNVIGNHDLNLDGVDRNQINETFESLYGPTWYSFDHGNVHFVVLDNIDWAGPATPTQRQRANDQIDVETHGHFVPKFGERQLEFVQSDLAAIPADQMVVLLMHVPIMDTEDRVELYRLIENRPLCVSVAAHTHSHSHYFLGKADGFNGPKPHHHIVNVTVSGAWWSGAKDERGVPHTTMADGAPNGYSIMTFERDRYLLDFKAAGLPASEQMRIRVPRQVKSDQTGATEIWVNVFNGSTKSTVEFSMDDESQWQPLEQKVVNDPHVVELVKRESKISPAIEPRLGDARPSNHLWHGLLPANLQPGVHLLKVRTIDMHDRTWHGQRSIRVTP